MKFIEEFVERVFAGPGSFEIQSDSCTYHYIKDQVGTATYIYSIRSWGDAHDCARISNKPELTAILAKDTIYIVDMFHLGLTNRAEIETLSAHIASFSKARERKHTYMQEKLLPMYYALLDSKEITDEEVTRTGQYASSYCRSVAREGLFSGTDTETYIKVLIQKMLGFTLSEDEFARTLCGFTTLEELAKKQFEKNKERWADEKSLIEKIRAYMNTPDTVKDWEMFMSENINSTDAKNITVEFKKDIFSYTGKIEPHRLLNRLQKEGRFGSYDFSGSRAETAGADRNFTCEDIVKITYGKKVLFSKTRENG